MPYFEYLGDICQYGRGDMRRAIESAFTTIKSVCLVTNYFCYPKKHLDISKK